MTRPIIYACGTYPAARRHERNNEPLDDPCTDALRAYRAAATARVRARKQGLCADPSPPTLADPRGIPLACSLGRNHEGRHVARDANGARIASWR